MTAMPLQITFRDILPSDAVRARITSRVEELAQFHPRIMSCRVVVRAPHRRQHKGKLYSIRIDLKVPRREIVINRTPVARRSHEDIYVAIRDAFDALVRRLEDAARRRRGDVKSHAGREGGDRAAAPVRPVRRRRAKALESPAGCPHVETICLRGRRPGARAGRAVSHGEDRFVAAAGGAPKRPRAWPAPTSCRQGP